MLGPSRKRFRGGYFSRVERTLQESVYSSNPPGQRKDPVPGLAGLKEMALEAARRAGFRVISADKRQVLNNSGQRDGIVIYYSSASDNWVVKRHLGAGGLAVFVREGKILAASGWGASIIADAGQGGSTDPAELEDALAAAGLLALGIYP
ncbi:MAG: hypothetical protein BWY80_00203 [Firmicutes bacterium ADurb.Bin456]|nr:MAG: hypothetical protein BWY80_00203 [Firmicutes bacterium ADurb.Bin456]